MSATVFEAQYSPQDLYDQTLGLLQELVRNACVNEFTPDSGQEVRNADTLERYLTDGLTPKQRARLELTRVEPYPGRVSLIATVRGEDPQAHPLSMLGHIDVVPVDEARWTKPPFGAVIEDGKVYGRGTVDMLFLTATYATVIKQIAKTGAAGTMHFAALADEEARGTFGAAWIAEHQPDLISWENCLSETGGSHLPGKDGSDSAIIYVGEKGAAQRRLHVHGDPGHGSTPFGKDSAIARIAEVAQRLAAASPEISDSDIWHGFVDAFRLDPATDAALRAGNPEAYLALDDLAAFGDAVSHLTVSQTVLRAGQAINVLPSHAWLELDIRVLPGQDNDYVDDFLRQALGDLAEEVTIERLLCDAATLSPVEHPLFDVLADTLRGFFPEATIVPMIAAGGSDLRFARRKGGAGYGFAVHPVGRTLGHAHGQLHSHDEYLYLEDLDMTLAGHLQVARAFLGAKF